MFKHYNNEDNQKKGENVGKTQINQERKLKKNTYIHIITHNI